MSSWMLTPSKPPSSSMSGTPSHSPLSSTHNSILPTPDTFPHPPFTRYQNVIAHLPSLPHDTIPTYDIPTSRILSDEPSFDTDSEDPSLAIDREHASSTAYDAETSTLLRILGNGHILELRSLRFAFPKTNTPSTTQLVTRFKFPEPLRDLSGGDPIHTCPTTGSSTISLLDEKNYLFILTLPSISSFKADKHPSIFQYDERKRMVEEYQVDENRFEGLGVQKGGKIVWGMVGKDAVAVGIREGILLMKIVGGDITYTTIRQTSYLHSFSLNPFSRPRASTQIIALQSVSSPSTSSPGTTSYIFAYSMDLKLRVFSIDSNGTHGLVGIVDIVASAGTGAVGGGSANGRDDGSRAGSLIPGTPLRGQVREGSMGRAMSGTPGRQLMLNGSGGAAGSTSLSTVDDLSSTLLHVYSSPYQVAANTSVFYAITFTPTPSSTSAGFFTISKLTIKARAVEFKVVQRVGAEEGTSGGELRGFWCEVLDVGDFGQEQEEEEDEERKKVWRLWACFDVAGKTLVQEVNATGAILGESGSPEDDQPRWRTSFDIDNRLHPELDASHFEHLLQRDYGTIRSAQDVKSTFLDELFYPGRYSIRTIQAAVEEYVQVNIYDRLEEDDVPDDVDYSCKTLREKVETVIGCHLGEYARRTTTTDREQRNAELENDEREMLVRECQGFWSSVLAQDRQARWPVQMFPLGNGSESGVFVACRDCVLVPIVQDEVSLLWGMSEGEDGGVIRYEGQASLGKNYPMLEVPSRRADILSLVEAAQTLAAIFGKGASSNFAQDVLQMAKSPLSTPIAGLMAAYRAQTDVRPIPDDVVDHLANILPPGHPMSLSIWNGLLDLLIGHAIGSDWNKPDEELLTTFMGMSLSLAMLQQVALTRTSTMTSLLLLLGYMVSRPLEDTAVLNSIVGRATSGLSQLHLLQYVTEQPAEEAKSSVRDDTSLGQDGLQSSFQALGIQGDEVADATPDEACYSLMYVACGAASTVSPSTTTGSATLLSSASNIAYLSGILSDQPVVSASPLNAKFASRMLHLNCVAQMLEYIEAYPPNPALEYLRGRAILAWHSNVAERATWAAEAFDAVSPVFNMEDWQRADDTGLELVLPEDVIKDGQSTYLVHVMDVFERAGETQMMLQYAAQAIDAIPGMPEEPHRAEPLRGKVFRGHLKLGQFEDAYTVMMQTLSAKRTAEGSTTDRPLATLINAMCSANQFQELIALPFDGVQAEVEAELTYKAHNSEPDATPNYYMILHAWHVRKSDFLEAGKIMYIHGRRIGEQMHLHPEDLQATLSSQALSYLTAIHALDMVAEHNAWFASPKRSGRSDARATKRGKTSHFARDDFSSKSKARDIEIITLDDIRQKYAVLLGTLQLLTDAELVLTDANFSADDCLLALVCEGMYDRAFSLAETVGADMSGIFGNLTERCLELAGLELAKETIALEQRGAWLTQSETSMGWRGSLPEKAWRFLQAHLQRYDTEKTGFSYQNTVAETIASVRRFPLPTWLVARGLAVDADDLLRIALKYGRESEALGWASERVRKNPVGQKRSAEGMLSYSMLDQVVAENSTGIEGLRQDIANRFKLVRALA